MVTFVWKDNGSVGWDGTFGQQNPTPSVEGEDAPSVWLDCYVGQQKIGEIHAWSSHYSINHETEWTTEARSVLRHSRKSFGKYPNYDSNLQAMKDFVEGEFTKFITKAGL